MYLPKFFWMLRYDFTDKSVRYIFAYSADPFQSYEYLQDKINGNKFLYL